MSTELVTLREASTILQRSWPSLRDWVRRDGLKPVSVVWPYVYYRLDDLRRISDGHAKYVRPLRRLSVMMRGADWEVRG